MRHAWALLGVLFLVGVVTQHALGGEIDGPGGRRIPFVAAGLSVFVLTVAAGFRPAWRRFLTSNRFAVPSIVVLAFLSVIGTLILQGRPVEVMRAAYGSVLDLIRSLFLGDIFHSVGFSAVLGAGAGGLALTVCRRRRLTARYAGALCAHTGLLLVLAGAVLGNVWVVRGELGMHVGQSADHFLVDAGDGGKRKSPLGFEVRLDDFELELYEPEYSLVVIEIDGRDERRLASVDPASDETGGLAEFGLEVVGYWPDRVREPVVDRLATAVLQSPHVIVAGDRRIPVTIGQSVELPSGRELTVLRFLPDFVLDSKTRKPASRSDRPDNPAVEVECSQGGETRWLFARFPDFRHPGDDAELAGVRYEHRGGSGRKSSDRAVNPVVRLRRKGRPGTVDLTPGRPIRLGDDRVVVLAPRRGDPVRDYLSTLSVWEGGRKVLEKVVEVNYPLEHRGFVFYQSDYRPDDPTFSGFQVVQDSGLWLVYLGFAVNLAGILTVVFLPALLRRRRPACEPEGGGS